MLFSNVFNDLESENSDYKRILLACSIASKIVYESKPGDVLKNEYAVYDHRIVKISESQTLDDYRRQFTDIILPGKGLEVKYVVCEQVSESSKRLIVAFRGTKTMNDVFCDLNMLGRWNEFEGQFHLGFLTSSDTIPITYFIHKLIKENYQIVYVNNSFY